MLGKKYKECSNFSTLPFTRSQGMTGNLLVDDLSPVYLGLLLLIIIFFRVKIILHF